MSSRLQAVVIHGGMGLNSFRCGCSYCDGIFIVQLLHAAAGPFPDGNLGAVLSSRTSSFDYVLIQFYNNNCGYSGNDEALKASYNQWKGTCANLKTTDQTCLYFAWALMTMLSMHQETGKSFFPLGYAPLLPCPLQ